jgi:iron-sulfur cluster assembly accessory protein
MESMELNMTIIEETKVESITLTQPAAEAVRSLMAEKQLQGYALRVFVQGGGCSGIQYGLALDNNIRPTDVTSQTDGIQVICDDLSIQYLTGATVDFVQGPQGSGFKIENPNPLPTSSCNCGDGGGGGENCGCN